MVQIACSPHGLVEQGSVGFSVVVLAIESTNECLVKIFKKINKIIDQLVKKNGYYRK